MLVSWDSETHKVLPGLLAPPMVCVSAQTKSDGGLNYPPALYDKKEGLVLLGQHLAADTKFVVHNGAYDFACLCNERPDLIPLVFKAYAEDRVFDTQVRQQLIDIRNGCLGMPRHDGTRGVSLNALTNHYLGKDRSEDKHGAESWRLRYAELEHLPVEEWPERARLYALDDASDTLEVYEAQEAKYAASGAFATQHLQVRAAWALHLMSCWGLRTDGQMVRELAAKLEEESKKNFEALKAEGFYKVGGTKKAPKWTKNMAAIRERVRRAYAAKKKPIPMTDGRVNKATGERVPEVATDKDTLKQSGDESLDLLAGGGGVDKILSTYVPALKQGEKGPINVRFNVLVDSGRTSSYGTKNEVTGEAEGFNAQNMPTGRKVGGVRDCVVPRGHESLADNDTGLDCLFVSVDYDTLEMKALAQVLLKLFGEARMAEALKAGRDLHVEVASTILNTTYEDVQARRKAGDKAAKSARDAGKPANFGFAGGLGAETLVEYARTGYGVILTAEQAYELKKLWLATWPEMKTYFRYISNLVGDGGATVVHPITGFVRGDVGYTDGCNHFFQHLAAVGAKEALFNVAHECYVDLGTPLFGCRPVNFVHDEIIAEIPKHKAHEASTRLAEVMCSSMQKWIPDIPITASPALMTRWLKNAEPTYVDGRLVPWEPAAD